MASSKPPVLPPETPASDTTSPDGNGQVQAVKPYVEFGGNPTVNNSANKHLNLKLHAIDFVVNYSTIDTANPRRFLKELLHFLHTVDPKAVIMPHKDAAVELSDHPLHSVDSIPVSTFSARKFLDSYIEKLRTFQTAMQGKVTVRSHANFSTFKQKEEIKKWLNGSIAHSGHSRIQLDKTTLSCSVRHCVGFFVNTVTRHDLADNFHERLSLMYLSNPAAWKDLPEFQIEAKTVYRGKHGAAKLYRIMSAKDDVELLQVLMRLLMPNPTADVSFIPKNVWDSLPTKKKDEYFLAHKNFSESHNALIFRGINDARCIIRPSHDDMSIIDWIRGLLTSDGQNLFYRVEPCLNGEMELWHSVAHEKEAKVWLSSALVIIGSMAQDEYGLPETCDNYDTIFKSPDKVRTKLDTYHHGVFLPETRQIYLSFDPKAAVSTPLKAGSARRTNHNSRSKKLKLVYDVDLDEVASVLSHEETTAVAKVAAIKTVAVAPVLGTRKAKLSRSRKIKSEKTSVNSAVSLVKKKETGTKTAQPKNRVSLSMVADLQPVGAPRVSNKKTVTSAVAVNQAPPEEPDAMDVHEDQGETSEVEEDDDVTVVSDNKTQSSSVTWIDEGESRQGEERNTQLATFCDVTARGQGGGRGRGRGRGGGGGRVGGRGSGQVGGQGRGRSQERVSVLTVAKPTASVASTGGELSAFSAETIAELKSEIQELRESNDAKDTQLSQLILAVSGLQATVQQLVASQADQQTTMEQALVLITAPQPEHNIPMEQDPSAATTLLQWSSASPPRSSKTKVGRTQEPHSPSFPLIQSPPKKRHNGRESPAHARNQYAALEDDDMVDLEFVEDPAAEALECISSLSICEAPSPPEGGAGSAL